MAMRRNQNPVRYVKILVLIFCLNDCVFSKDLPAVLRDLKCPLNKDFDACFVVNGNKAIPLMAKGDPEYGIPNMIPLKLPFINLISTPLLQLNLTNVEIHGLDKMKITDHKTVIDKGLFTGYFFGKNITMVGDYEADGHILVVSLRGKGRFSMYFKNGRYISQNTIEVIEKNGEKYFKPTENKFNAKFEKIVFNFENLFDGNKVLGDEVNAYLNKNWKLLVEEFGPRIGQMISNVDHGIFQKFAAVVPLKNLYI